MAQTQNENASGSCNPSGENRFLYFSYLLEDDDNDAQGSCKRAKRELKEFSKLPPPLGLRLAITPSLVQQIEQKLNGADVARAPCREPPNNIEKLKAVHLPMCSLVIGFYSIEARYPADLVAKFYFARRRLVWEILDKGLKHKVEIQWQNISAIRASIEENKPGDLEIELDRVPSFFSEATPLRGKRTVWIGSSDFTSEGCASRYRRHSLRFPPGVLDQHYPKLLQLDNRLLELSRAPFPSSESGYFDSYPNEGTAHIQFGHDLHAHGSRTTPASEQPILDPHLVSTQQVKLYGNAMPMSFGGINDLRNLTSPSPASEQQPAFDLPVISTQQVQLYENLTPNDPTSLSSAFQQQPSFDLPMFSTQQVQRHDNMMPLLISAINNPTSLSSAYDQQFTFDLPLISTQQVQLYDNTVPLSFDAISDPTSQPSACEQFAFDLPVVSSQQVQPYESTMPLSTSAINESTPLSSGICSPTNEAISNQLFQDPSLATCNPELDVQRCSFYQQLVTFPHNNGSLYIEPRI